MDLPSMDSTELTQFGLKQLFYQVKQSFPEVPDAIVNECIRKARYNRQAAEALLTREAPKYGRAVPMKKTQSSPKSLSAGNSPMDSSARSLGECPTPTKVPPPLPVTPPVALGAAASGPSPPIYASPLYRPDTDLSLPPPDATGRPSQVQVICEQPRSSTSVNVILQPTADTVPYVTYSSASTDHLRGLHSQLKITISPQGGTVSAVQRSGLSPWNYGIAMPSSPSMNLVNQGYPSLPENAEHIREQCERRESLRRSLDEDRQRLVSLRKRVEQLQEELTIEKRLLGQPEPVQLPHHPPPLYRQQAVIDLERLKCEVRNLELDCQRMVQELDIQTVRRSTGSPTTPVAPPTPMNGPHMASPPVEEDDDGWNCSRCTFYNHPALSKCEECESPRPCTPTTSQGVMGIRSFIPYSRPGNIHIHVRHRPQNGSDGQGQQGAGRIEEC